MQEKLKIITLQENNKILLMILSKFKGNIPSHSCMRFEKNLSNNHNVINSIKVQLEILSNKESVDCLLLKEDP